MVHLIVGLEYRALMTLKYRVDMHSNFPLRATIYD